MLVCEFCNKECKNKISFSCHMRLCPKNPNRKYKNGMLGKTAWNKGTRGHPLCARKKGTIGYKHSEEIKKKLSELAKSRGLGGYVENAGISKKFKVKDSFGKETVLQSSYELKCSVLLEELGFKWNRPKSLKYDGKNYFADFYLPDFDIYLDPKNNYKAKLDAEKIKKVREQNNVKIFILLKEQITKEYLTKICIKKRIAFLYSDCS